MIVTILWWLKSTEDKINAKLKITSAMASANNLKPMILIYNQNLIINNMPDFPPLATSSVHLPSKNQKPQQNNSFIKKSKSKNRVNQQSL